MRTDVAQIDLRLRRRSILWFAFGLAIYAFMIVAMYPSVKSDASLGALTADNPTVAALLGVNGSAWAADVTQTVPQQHVDLALVIKAIPCLQQIDKGIGLRLLEGVQADHMLVSYPTQSIGGREKGMRATYEAQFNELVAGKGWTIRRYDFPTELAFLITKTTGTQKA